MAVRIIRYAEDIVLMVEKKKLEWTFKKLARESEKKGLSIKYKKTECRIIRKRLS